MTQNVKGLNIPISYDMKAIDRNIKQTKNSFNQLKRSLKDVQYATKLDPKGLKGLTKESEILAKAVEQAEKRYTQLQDKLEKMSGNEEVDKLGKAFNDVVRDIGYAKRELDKWNLAQKMYKNANGTGFGSSLGHFKNVALGIKEVTKGQLEWGNVATKGISMMDIALGNLVANGISKTLQGYKNLIKESIQLGMSFEEAVANLKALYGSEISQDDMTAIVEKAKELGTTTVYNSVEVANAMRSMALAGYDAKDTINAIESALDLASASGEDFETVSSILVDGLKAFGYETTQATDFANALGLTAVITNADVADLGEAFKYVGAVAGTFNYSINDVAVALGAMASNGIKGSIAGTSLRQMLLRLSTNTGKATDEFEKIGGKFYDTSGKAQSLLSVLNDLRAGVKGMTDQQKALTLETIGGQRAITGLSAIVSLSEEDWSSLSKELEHTEGAVKSIAQQRLDNLAGDVKILKNNLDNARLDFFEELKPKLREVTKDMTAFIKSADFKKIIKDLASLGKSLTKAFVGTFKFVISNVDELAFSLKTLIPILITAKGAFSISSNLMVMAKNSGMADVALNAFAKSLKFTSLTVVGVVAGLALLKYGWDYIYKQAKDKIQYIYDTNEALRQNKQAVIDSAKATKDNIDQASAKSANDKAMLQALDKYIDKNGKIKEGYEERTNFILNDFKNAYGIEYEIIDGAISKWGELKTSIKEASEQRMIDAIAQAYNEDLVVNMQARKDAQDLLIKGIKDEQTLLQQVRDEMVNNKNNSYWKTEKDASMDYNNFIKLTFKEQMDYIAKTRCLNALITLQGTAYVGIKQNIDSAKQSLLETSGNITSIQNNLNTLYDTGVEGWLSLSNGATTFKEKSLDELSMLKYEQFRTVQELKTLMAQAPQEDKSTFTDMFNDAVNNLRLIEQEIEARKDTNKIDVKIQGDIKPFQDALTEVENIKANMNEKNKVMFASQAQQDIASYKATLTNAQPIINQSANTLGTQTVSGISTGINTGSGQLNATVKSVTGNALSQNELSNSSGYNSGVNYASGITSGINSGGWNVIEASRNLARMANKAFRDELEIRSPSKVGEESASWYPQGIVQGLLGGIPKVALASSQLTSAITTTMSNARETSIKTVGAMANIDYQTDISNMFINALQNVQMVLDAYIDIDGRPIANHISRIQGMQIKKGML